MNSRSEYGSEDEENDDEGESFEERQARFAEPIEPFTETLTEWQHPHTYVWFSNPTRETNPDSRGVPTEVVVWDGQCVADGCPHTFLVAHRLPPPGYPQNMPTPKMMRSIRREHCDFHVAGVKPNLPPEKWPVLHAYKDAEGRCWEPVEYQTQTLLTGEKARLGVWESPCRVPGCTEFVEYTGVARGDGTPMRPNVRKPLYCETHKFGRVSKHAATPEQAAWFKEKNKGKRERALAALAEQRAKRVETFVHASPEERLRLAALRKEQMKPWLEACAATRERRKVEYAAASAAERAAIDAKKAAIAEGARLKALYRRETEGCAEQHLDLSTQRELHRERAVEALRAGTWSVISQAHKRGWGAAEVEKRIAASRTRVWDKWMCQWNAAHPEARIEDAVPPYVGPAIDVPAAPVQAPASAPPVKPVSAPPVKPVSAPSAPAPAPAQDAVARAKREYSAAFRVLSANATGGTLENLCPEYKAILTYTANQANGTPVFDRISSNKPNDNDASAIVDLFERMPLAVTLEWEGAWRMAHRLGSRYADRQLANREGARVNKVEAAFNAAFGWQPGHNCYHYPTEDALLAKALKESRAELAKAAATLDKVREQMEELPLRALMEDVAQIEADLMAQEIAAQESLERIQRQREPMLRRKAERDLDDATQKALRERHKEPDCPIPAYLYQRGVGQDSDYNP